MSKRTSHYYSELYTEVYTRDDAQHYQQQLQQGGGGGGARRIEGVETVDLDEVTFYFEMDYNASVSNM